VIVIYFYRLSVFKTLEPLLSPDIKLPENKLEKFIYGLGIFVHPNSPTYLSFKRWIASTKLPHSSMDFKACFKRSGFPSKRSFVNMNRWLSPTLSDSSLILPFMIEYCSDSNLAHSFGRINSLIRANSFIKFFCVGMFSRT
jgi:hypothetical protein